MKKITQTWFFEQDAETVWAYLTNADLLGKWLMPNDIQPIAGHKFRFTAKPLPQMDFDGNVYCEVLEVQPLKLLSYSWKGGPNKDTITLNTVVTWTLQSKDNGTELVLVQSGFKDPENRGAYMNMNNGWSNHILARLAELLKQANDETATK